MFSWISCYLFGWFYFCKMIAFFSLLLSMNAFLSGQCSSAVYYGIEISLYKLKLLQEVSWNANWMQYPVNHVVAFLEINEIVLLKRKAKHIWELQCTDHIEKEMSSFELFRVRPTLMLWFCGLHILLKFDFAF